MLRITDHRRWTTRIAVITRIVPALLSISIYAGAEAPSQETDLKNFTPVGALKEEQSFQDYRVRLSLDSEQSKGSIEILKKDERVYAATVEAKDLSLDVSCDVEEGRPNLVAIGKDTDGNGAPNLIIRHRTSEVNCCTVLHIFEIGRSFRFIQKINAEYSSEACFTDFDGDSNLELALNDWTFAYWHMSFARSPKPEIILRYRQGAFRLATDLMRIPGPTHGELMSRAHEIRNHHYEISDDLLSDLMKDMLYLIYTGHMDLAWKFYDAAWPSDRKEKDEFLRDFRAKLSESPYWQDLRTLNGH